MRFIFLFLIYIEELLAAPAWVENLRGGEERFKLQNGTTTMFRQIARNCETAMKNLERDIEREYGELVKFTTEVIYEDELGCAVTASINNNKIERKPVIGIERALQLKALKAQKHAYVGLTYKEFKQFTKDSSPIVYNADPYSYCLRSVNTVYESIHGLVHICWKDQIILAHCIPEVGKCWKKLP